MFFLPVWISALAVLVALALDRWPGEPTARWHPVVWMGNFLTWAGGWVQSRTRQTSDSGPDLKAFWLAAAVWCAGAAMWLMASVALQQAVMALASSVGEVPGGLLAALLLGATLKPMLAWAMLHTEVTAVEQALDLAQGGGLAAGRQRLRWLVSRDVSALSDSQVRESAIESLAENLNDSVVAPLLWFVVLGLPGAVLYRFANTADAMWGYPGVYQGRNWAWAGKWAARADDMLSWLPARITALLLALLSGRVGFGRLRREARRTPSPNSGWPMAAMALALGVCLQKPGVYVLNSAGRAPCGPDTRLALSLASRVTLTLVLSAGATFLFVVTGLSQWG